MLIDGLHNTRGMPGNGVPPSFTRFLAARRLPGSIRCVLIPWQGPMWPADGSHGIRLSRFLLCFWECSASMSDFRAAALAPPFCKTLWGTR